MNDINPLNHKKTMSDNTIPILANFDDVKKEIWESDLILIRNTKGNDTRLAKASWWDKELFGVEVRKYRGVTAVSLQQLVVSYPGRIDIFEANTGGRWEMYDRPSATRHLKNTVLSKDDCRSTLLESLWNLFSKHILRTEEKRRTTPYGAEAIRIADRLGGGVDPVPDATETWADANDLLLSPFYRYRFTLK